MLTWCVHRGRILIIWRENKENVTFFVDLVSYLRVNALRQEIQDLLEMRTSVCCSDIECCTVKHAILNICSYRETYNWVAWTASEKYLFSLDVFMMEGCQLFEEERKRTHICCSDMDDPVKSVRSHKNCTRSTYSCSENQKIEKKLNSNMIKHYTQSFAEC